MADPQARSFEQQRLVIYEGEIYSQPVNDQTFHFRSADSATQCCSAKATCNLDTYLAWGYKFDPPGFVVVKWQVSLR